jgi:hypothetical protein
MVLCTNIKSGSCGFSLPRYLFSLPLSIAQIFLSFLLLSLVGSWSDWPSHRSRDSFWQVANERNDDEEKKKKKDSKEERRKPRTNERTNERTPADTRRGGGGCQIEKYKHEGYNFCIAVASSVREGWVQKIKLMQKFTIINKQTQIIHLGALERGAKESATSGSPLAKALNVETLFCLEPAVSECLMFFWGGVEGAHLDKKLNLTNKSI